MNKETQAAIIQHAQECERSLMLAQQARERGERQSAMWHGFNAHDSSTRAFIVAGRGNR